MIRAGTSGAPRRPVLSALPLLLLLLLAVPGLAGCETAPATGKTIFTGGMSMEREREIGAREHRRVLAQFGLYEDAALSAYVDSIGQRLADTSELPDLAFSFIVLDSPTVNAFALPGGYVYVTRGLVELANNEAQLAGVLAHEIGHVTARHAAERYGSAVAASVAQAGLGALFGAEAARAGGGAAMPLLQSFSREQEFEADTLGVRYLTRAGYDPGAMAAFLTQLQAHSRLEAEIAGRPGSADAFDIMQTHPRTADRIREAVAAAGVRPVASPVVGRDVYLDRIDGMISGDSPAQGFVRGPRFLHPELRFAFTVPEGFRLRNTPQQVSAVGPGESVIVFDRARRSTDLPILRYLVEDWARNLRLTQVAEIEVNDMPAATGAVRSRTSRGPRDLRLVAIRYGRGTIYRFLFVTPPALSERLAVGLRRTTYSFRRLSAAEAAELRPHRLHVRRIAAGDSVAGLAAQLPFAGYREARLRVLNGLARDAVLRPGERLKLVVGER